MNKLPYFRSHNLYITFFYFIIFMDNFLILLNKLRKVDIFNGVYFQLYWPFRLFYYGKDARN